MQKLFFLLATSLIALSVLYAFVDNKRDSKTAADDFIVDTLAKNLTVPWAMVFIDKETLLFTERNGKVRLLRNDQLVAKPVLIVSQADTTKKMGLLGLCLHPDFENNKYVYISYNYRNENKPLLRVVRYRFYQDSLLEPNIIIEGINASPNHTGCRLKFGPDKKLYITTGDADRPILAQDLKSLNGKILRVNDDGTIPADNPFVNNDTAHKEIWTYGHRNTQGIAFQASTNSLYNSEHGPTGGDEINQISKGMNYGWPIIHHKETGENMLSPLIEFTPSVGPSETVFYNGDAFPHLKGSLLLACLRGESILRFKIDGQKIIAEGNLFQHRYGRIRALAVCEEGYIYFSTSQNDPPEGKPIESYDMICRIRPSKNGNSFQPNLNTEQTSLNKSNTKKSPETIYIEMCAGCHGKNLEGTERAKSMLDDQWQYGSAKQDIIKSIRNGVIEKGMPAFEGTLNNKEIKKLTDFIIKKRG